MREQIAADRCPSLGDLVLASDGGLSPEHKASMTEHLRQCEPCQDRLRQANAFLEASADVVDDESGVKAPLAVAAGNVVNLRGMSERAGNARAAMPVSFENEFGAEYDSHAKDVARNREFARRLHKQNQALIHRPTPVTAWVRQWLPVAALIPLLILGLSSSNLQALERVESLLTRAFHALKLAVTFEGTGRRDISKVDEAKPRAGAVKAAPVAPIAPTTTAPVAMADASSLASRGAAGDKSLSPVTTMVGRAPVSQPALSRWLDRTFRASPERKTFVPTLQRLVIDVRQHLSELDTLARRYPEAEVVEQWSSADEAMLRKRVEESYRRISRDLNDLDLHVSVLFGSRTRSFPITEAPADWRHRAAAALAHAESMDAQVRDLLKSDDVPSSSGDAKSTSGARVPVTFAALWDVVHAPAGGPASRQ